jgi:hypothetical protein
MIPRLSICASVDRGVKDRSAYLAEKASAPHGGGKRTFLPSRLCNGTMLIDASVSLWTTNRVALTIRSSRSADFRRKPRQGVLCGEHSARPALCRRTKSGIEPWQDMTTGIPANQ